MPDTPKLSICVPSRNRQDCFRQTIGDLTANPRTDIEFVFADNSDDPAIMDDFMRGLQDPRVTYLRSEASALSMAENWERTLAAARGDWITIIGDDDYVDTDLPDYVAAVEARDAGVEAIAWNRALFQWPEVRTTARHVSFSLANRIQRHSQEQIAQRLFGWLAATYLPQCPYGIYHAAVPRRTLERISARFPGPFFDHPMVDYNFSHKLVVTVGNLVYIDRPMSVPGVARNSNSAAVGDARKTEISTGAYKRDQGDVFENAVVAAGFPFRVETGVSGAIMGSQFWFKQTHGIEYPRWEEDFCRAMSLECSLWTNRAEYDDHVAVCRAAFDLWEGGRYRHLFRPRFTGDGRTPPLLGVLNTDLFIDQAIAGVRTPAEFHGVLKQILPLPETMELAL
jgi:hypothetical protein